MRSTTKLVVVVIADTTEAAVHSAREFVGLVATEADLVLAMTVSVDVPQKLQLLSSVRVVQPPRGLTWSDEDIRRQLRWELVREYPPDTWVVWAERGGLSFIERPRRRLPRTERVAWITDGEDVVQDADWARHARPLLRSALASSLFTLGGVGIGLLYPWPLKVAVDAMNGGTWAGFDRPATVAAAMAALSVVLVLAGAATEYGAALITGRVAERAGADMRSMVLRRLLHMPMPFFDTYSSGELLTRLGSDVERVQDGMLRIVTSIVPEAATLIGMIVVLMLIDPALALVGVLAVPLLAVVTLLKRAPTDRLQREYRRRQGDLQATTSDLLRNARAIQGLGAEPWAVAQYGERTEHAVAASLKNVEFSARMSPLTDVVLAILSAVVLWLGVMRVSSGHLSVGSLLVVFSYLSGFYSPVRELARIGQILARTAASRDRLSEILTHPLPKESLLSERPAVPVDRRVPDDGPGPQARQMTGATLPPAGPRRRSILAMERVSFSYPNGRHVLDDVSFSLRENEHLCIIGPSGMGKTTLLHLLVRLYEPTSGLIKVEGVDVRDRPMDWLRSRLALVPQDCWILDATLRENLILDAPHVVEADITQALRLALLDDVVGRLAQGLDTRLGEGGARLSGGERRRVALARSLIRGAKVLLLDEPTSGLDSASERKIVESIAMVATQCAVVSVTHSPSVAAIASRTLTMRERTLVPLERTIEPPTLLETRRDHAC